MRERLVDQMARHRVAPAVYLLISAIGVSIAGYLGFRLGQGLAFDAVKAQAIANVLSTIITLLAVVVALSSAVATDRRAETDRRDRIRRDERKQANQVAAWVSSSFPWGAWDEMAPADKLVWNLRLVVSNASTTPVYSVDIMVSNAHGFTTKYPVAWPGRMPAGTNNDALEGKVRLAQYTGPFKVAIIFTDAAGIRWYRDFAGTLSKADDGFTTHDAWLQVQDDICDQYENRIISEEAFDAAMTHHLGVTASTRLPASRPPLGPNTDYRFVV